jgi:general secretion pathway protein J
VKPRAGRAVRLSFMPRQTGFSLLELLVALSVLGLVLIALNHGVRTGLGVWNVQSRQINRTKDLDATARVLRTVLTQIPVAASTNPASPPAAIAFTGKPDELALVGNLPTGLGTDSYADMALHLNAKRLVLNWSPHRHELVDATPAANVTEILQGVEHLDIAYWGPPSPNAPSAWLAGWDGPALPGLVRIRLSFAAKDARRWPDLIIAPRF